LPLLRNILLFMAITYPTMKVDIPFIQLWQPSMKVHIIKNSTSNNK
jgi:hypothetical protein